MTAQQQLTQMLVSMTMPTQGRSAAAAAALAIWSCLATKVHGLRLSHVSWSCSMMLCPQKIVFLHAARAVPPCHSNSPAPVHATCPPLSNLPSSWPVASAHAFAARLLSRAASCGQQAPHPRQRTQAIPEATPLAPPCHLSDHCFDPDTDEVTRPHRARCFARGRLLLQRYVRSSS